MNSKIPLNYAPANIVKIFLVETEVTGYLFWELGKIIVLDSRKTNGVESNHPTFTDEWAYNDFPKGPLKEFGPLVFAS